ncbi:hypothetical protein CAPTEDRAFT_192931 [Capitella teleta]|uniref:Globin domain-containing protein n=1 Tax=Capitella teleta TaxID=283909 RepID=R7V6C3_CAPTE|nr:hypothetical protein CAPTEDRAFT_192931 [Capitella teleta]|eukprot:ELU11901.1 hypothetical protein CAPTEDRAFT_192931 [Capitella teleta]
MGLTKAQIAAIQNNWARISNNLQDFGDTLFMRYLTIYPGDLAFFPKFEHEGVGDHLRHNADFQAQTLVVCQFLSKVIASLSDMDAAKAMLQERVRTHAPRGIAMAQFERLLDLLPRLVQDASAASGPTADAWRVAVASLMPAMRQEFAKV